MGVLGLTTALENRGAAGVELRLSRNKECGDMTLLVDALSVLIAEHDLMHSTRLQPAPWVADPENFAVVSPSHLVDSIEKYVKAWRTCGVKLVWYFDVSSPDSATYASRMETRERRRAEGCKKIYSYLCRYSSGDIFTPQMIEKSDHLPGALHPRMVEACIAKLESMPDTDVYYEMGESDDVLAIHGRNAGRCDIS